MIWRPLRYMQRVVSKSLWCICVFCLSIELVCWNEIVTNPYPNHITADPATPKPAKPRGQKRALAALALDPNLRDQWFELPGGWRKQIVTRKQGATAGGYDVYIYPPVGKKLRSNNDILRWVQANPTEEIDCVWVNMKVPLNQVTIQYFGNAQ